jgi:hypothetical protein
MLRRAPAGEYYRSKATVKIMKMKRKDYDDQYIKMPSVAPCTDALAHELAKSSGGPLSTEMDLVVQAFESIIARIEHVLPAQYCKMSCSELHRLLSPACWVPVGLQSRPANITSFIGLAKTVFAWCKLINIRMVEQNAFMMKMNFSKAHIDLSLTERIIR